MNKDEFQATCDARAADPDIGKRNSVWERYFANVLKKKIQLTTDMNSPINDDMASIIIDFARNRQDIMELSSKGRDKFISLMEQIPFGVSTQEFRKHIFNVIAKVRSEEMGLSKPDDEWLEKFTEHLDNKIFELLPIEEREALITSGIVTDDTNWSSGVHSIFFIWMVNPGTGKLELCRYIKDLQKVEFLHQNAWFPQKKTAGWELPKNYITFEGEPTFNVKKFTGI